MATLSQYNPFDASNFLAERDIQRFDGTANNLTPTLTTIGAVGTRYRRLTPVEYEDGISTPAGSDRPSAREISNEIFAQTGNIFNDRGLSNWNWLFGQFVNHDTDLAEEGDERFDIPIPADDPVFGVNGTNPQPNGVLRFERDHFAPETGQSEADRLAGKPSRSGVPGEAINTITAWLDMSTVYGSDAAKTESLRSHQGGKMLVDADPSGDLVPTIDGARRAGDVRARENEGLFSVHTVFLREHNRLADEVAAVNPFLTDEEVFQIARRINMAQYQNIIYSEWLPALGTTIPAFQQYDDTIDPQTTNAFAVAVFRFGHTLVSSDFHLIDENGTEQIGKLKDFFFAPNDGRLAEEVFRGFSASRVQETDAKAVDDLRNLLPIFGPVGLDLTAANIQRGRDRGLSDYNQLRRNLSIFVPEKGIQPVTSFAEITSDPALQAKLQELYGNVDNIDMFVGVLAEDRVPGTSMGPTLKAVMELQFQRFRDGDRFYFENTTLDDGTTAPWAFTPEQIAEIKNTTLKDIILRNTTIKETELQENLFFIGEKTAATPIVNQTLTGDAANNRLEGGDGKDRVNGAAGDDTVLGLANVDTVNGGAGNDFVDAGDGNDSVLGDVGDDTMLGRTGNDKMDGAGGRDLLNGGEGNDKLAGGQAADVVIGGFGKDEITTGGGNDIVVFGGQGNSFRQFKVDEVTDFKAGQDSIALSNSTFTALLESTIGRSVATVNNKNQARKSKALIVYNQSSGDLYYNENRKQNGFGQGGAFAQLDSGLNLAGSDFSVIP